MTMDIAAPSDLLITADNAECCRLLFNETEVPNAAPLDLMDLSLEVDWSRKRTLWLVHDLQSPEDLELIFEKVTDCSRVILVLPPSRVKGLGPAQACQRIQEKLLDQRLSIVMGGPMEKQIEALDALIDIDNFDGWKPILSNRFLHDNGEYLQTFYRKLAAQINIKMMLKNTQLEKSVSFLKNALINAPLATGRLRMEQFKGVLKNRPALIVAAGPSLNKQMEMLAQNKDLFTIFAVDRVWPILKKHGITPDVVVSLDPGSKPSWPDNAIDDETLFMVDLGSSPELVWSHNKNHLFTSCNTDVNACLKELGVDVEYMSTGGSVATTALSIALVMGANPIVLIGQDLALTGGQAYAEGYMHKPNAEFLKEQYDNGFDIVGYNGETVRTDRQLLFYKTWFENRIQALPAETMVINSTEGGACIEGALQLPFSAVCAEIRSAGISKKTLYWCAAEEHGNERLITLTVNLDDLISKLKAFQSFSEIGINVIRNKPFLNAEKKLKRIDSINKKIKTQSKNVKFITDTFAMAKFESIRYKTSTKYNLNKLTDAVEKYEEIYQSILESTDMSIEMIQRVKQFYKKVSQGFKINSNNVRDFG